jgi:predicted MFS family arabinose efflux permease
MGKVVAASALGLVAGPLIAGLLSDTAVMGRYATLELPFIVAAVLVLVTLVLVAIFFHDTRTERRNVDFGVTEVFLNLWRIRNRPTIIRLAVVWFFFELGLNAFFICMDDYMIEIFKFDTLQNSVLMTVFGLTMAFASGVLVGPLSTRFRKIPMVTASVVVMAVFLAVYLFNGISLLSYFLVVPIVVGFAIGYPTLFALFAASVGEDEQGWVMGITIALFTLGSGLIALAGGAMMTINANLPFITGIASFILALIFIAILWRRPDVRALDRREQDDAAETA